MVLLPPLRKHHLVQSRLPGKIVNFGASGGVCTRGGVVGFGVRHYPILMSETVVPQKRKFFHSPILPVHSLIL